jgi:3-methylcrotonyl-CoA carboxylase alpha subunit
VQRRHQKVLEEAPAPGMTAERRAAMGHAAIEAARAVGYVGAGTVEFIVAPDGGFFFMEMNTRLQVEHPVTEMITGLDLVEWQLRVAAGEPLPLRQDELAIHGHAIEARLYAEDPARGFLPSTGRLEHLAFPAATPDVRVDAGVAEGDAISPYYDAMIAKLIVHGPTRDAALRRMRQALSECRIAGVASNLGFLGRLIDTRAFASADLDTALIDREQAALFPPEPLVAREAWLAVAAGVLAREAAPQAGDPRDDSPWSDRSGWRLVEPARRRLVLRCRDEEAAVDVTYLVGATPVENAWRLELGGDASIARACWVDRVHLDLQLDDARHRVVLVPRGSGFWRIDAGCSDPVELVDPFAPRNAGAQAESHLRAPMPGRVVSLLARPGERVARGAPLLVLEAMKMEHTLIAPTEGTLDAYRVEAGDQVAEGAELVEFSPVPG